MKLSDLQDGQSGVIMKVRGYGAFRKRITEMGFVKGKRVVVIKNAPLKDPIEYSILGYNVTLRKSEASLIELADSEDYNGDEYPDDFNGVVVGEHRKTFDYSRDKVIKVALVGNPNAGKTTLFNCASKSNERVGNYAGVTVSVKEASFQQNGYTFEIADLPGTYSLSAFSPEELYVREYILTEIPDIVVNVLDSSNLERNLYLTTQLIDMDIKVVAALNMYDELLAKGDQFDYTALGKMIGIPFVPTISSKGQGIKELFDKIIQVYEDKDPIVRHIHINYGSVVERAILRLRLVIKEDADLTNAFSPRFLALKMLENDQAIQEFVSKYSAGPALLKEGAKDRKRIELELQDNSETVITDAKYGFISGALKETYRMGGIGRSKTTQLIDTLVTHRFWGFPLFFLFLWIMFESTFVLGAYPQSWIEYLVSALQTFLKTNMAEGMLKDLLTDGLINGVGGVLVFLPNILILFFFISFMEDSGYMARAAFIMDKLMHKMGLHGKSFIPLIMGFGCNVPAIMATRTIENKTSRLLTILINPLMSCSARLPVYILIVGAIFPHRAGTMLFFIYFLGIVLAIGIARLFKRVFFQQDEVPFVMELPPYRMPRGKTTLKHMWNKAGQYLQKTGGIISIAAILIWALDYFPQNVHYSKPYDQLIKSTQLDFQQKTKGLSEDQSKIFETQKDSIVLSYTIEKQKEHKEASYIGRIGKWAEPIVAPLGFDWRMTVSLMAGVAAKEIVVSTLGVIFEADKNANEESVSLKSRLRTATYSSGAKKGKIVFSPLTALAFMVFILIYFPCIGVVATISREAGWQWALFVVFYTTALAWIMAFVVKHLVALFVG